MAGMRARWVGRGGLAAVAMAAGGLFSIRREGQGRWVQGDASPLSPALPRWIRSDQVSSRGATVVTKCRS